MKPQLNKFFVISHFDRDNAPVYFDAECFAASLVDLRLTVRLTAETAHLRWYKAHCVEYHSELKLSKIKSN